MTTTELIELLKRHERGGATGRPREVKFEVDDRIIGTDGIDVTGTGDGLISELYLSLPFAQPEQRSFSCGQENDVISRKATIDALIRISGFDDKIKLIERCEKSVADCEGREGGILDCISEIEDLPSAQPEIIRCKDCKWKQGAECVRFADVRPFADDFCSRAERREE